MKISSKIITTSLILFITISGLGVGVAYGEGCWSKCKGRGETSSSACSGTEGGSSCPSTTFLVGDKFCGGSFWVWHTCTESTNAATPYFETWTYPPGSPTVTSTWKATCTNSENVTASFSAGTALEALQLAAAAGYDSATECVTVEVSSCNCAGGTKVVTNGVTSC